MNATSAPWIAGDYVHVAQRNGPASASSSRNAKAWEPHASSHAPQERTVAIDLHDVASMKATAWTPAAYLGDNWGRQRRPPSTPQTRRWASHMHRPPPR